MRIGIVFLTLLLCQSAFGIENRVYLLAGFNFKGSPVNLAALLFDPQVRSLSQCQDFINYKVRGTSRGKNFYRHYVVPRKDGAHIVPRYRCLETDRNIPRWIDRDFYKHIYLIDLQSTPIFTAFDSLNSCWAAIRNEPGKHSAKLYCAKMNQLLDQ